MEAVAALRLLDLLLRGPLLATLLLVGAALGVARAIISASVTVRDQVGEPGGVVPSINAMAKKRLRVSRMLPNTADAAAVADAAAAAALPFRRLPQNSCALSVLSDTVRVRC